MAKQAGLNVKELLEELKTGKLQPFYLLMGEEDYFIDQLSDYFEQNVIAEEYRDFDMTVFYGKDVETNMGLVVNTAKRYPMMSPQQLVIVKEAQTIRPEQWEALIPYVASPNATTVLVFCYRHKTMDKRTKVFQAIKRCGVVFESVKLRDESIPTWIAMYVRERGYGITERAAMLITEAIGNDLVKITNELGKIFIFLPKGQTINEDAIERYVGISKEYNVFELQKAIGLRDVVRCNKIINNFAQNPKSNPIQMILPLLYGYFIKIMIYLQLPDKAEAPEALGISPYFVKDYATAANNYTLGKLATCIGYLYEADLRSKGVHNTGSVTDGELLKELIFKIIH